MDYQRQSNCVYHCHYHVVLVTKYRRKIFNDGVHGYMQESFKEVAEYYPDIHILEMNHDEDHVHMLLSVPPKYSIGQVVRILKQQSARKLKAKFEFIRRTYWGGGGIWSDSYFVSTVGADEETIKKYIEMQGKEDSGQASLGL